jgi:FkbM family methyltransferase
MLPATLKDVQSDRNAAGSPERVRNRVGARDLVKRVVQKAGRTVGLDVRRYRPKAGRMGVNPFADIRKLLIDVARPVVFDVGANVGQSVDRFNELLPGCTLHAFEPSPSAFEELQANTRRIRNLTLVNAGVGAAAGTEILIENDHSDMSSFLSPGETIWGTVVRKTPIEVITLDEYCANQKLCRIDLLKIDTQGYELEVLKGAVSLMDAGAIHVIYTEITFSDLYEGLPPFDQLYRLLGDHGFRLVALYNFVVQNGVAGWCDALFTSARRN